MVKRRWTRLLLSLTIVAALIGCSSTITSSPRAGSQSAQASASPSNAVASEPPRPTADPLEPLPTAQPDQQAFAFADRAARSYFWINLNPTSAFEGTFVYTDEDAGMFWGAGRDGRADQTSRPDGSVEIRYDGPGWNDPTGTFDTLLWRYHINSDPSSMQLRLHGVIGADRTTASVALAADGQHHALNDGPPIGGADAAITEIAALLEAEDWRSLYLRIHEPVRASFDETTFVTEMTNGALPYGELVSVAVTSRAKMRDSGLGWDVAKAGLAVTFVKDGRRSTYPVDVEVVADGGTWWLTTISQIDPGASPTISATAAP